MQNSYFQSHDTTRVVNTYPAVLIIGPTGAGKTAFAYELANRLPAQIINGDLGQFYAPLTWGTAKPDWKNHPVRHFLFDHLDQPVSYNVAQFRDKVSTLITTLHSCHQIPIIVGGSTLYMHSLIFAPIRADTSPTSKKTFMQEDVSLDKQDWYTLQKIDPIRAQQIHPHDTYRIQRALSLWFNESILPSSNAPQFSPLAPTIVVHLMYERNALRPFLRERVKTMLTNGWFEEVQSLLETPWEQFWKEKKIIGYDAVANYLRLAPSGVSSYEALIETITQDTVAYAKKQEKYWRMLAGKIAPYVSCSKIVYVPVDLTLLSPHLYLEQLYNVISLLKIG